jgi:7-cyano-7-deazaguanine reductase
MTDLDISLARSAIEQLAGVHLGKAGDGTAVKPYVTPDHVDPSLLVAVPRVLNRTQYGIDELKLPFVGYDTWNCYEFSTLMPNGLPRTGLLRVVYPADSLNIVESKSLKLYLNSYNMVKQDHDDEFVMTDVCDKIRKDLSHAIDNDDIYVVYHESDNTYSKPITGDFVSLENMFIAKDVEFNAFNESPDLLKTTSNGYTVQQWRSSLLRSNCRVTNQPDWGDVYIHIKANKSVMPISLLQYIVSMRKENHFHEEICECIYKRLYDILNPDELLVACLYTRRGGIDINPVRASSDEVLCKYATNLTNADTVNIKTLRQ